MTEQEIAAILLEINAVTFNAENPYRYASGILSPIYCDNRLLMAYPDKRKVVIDAFIKRIEDEKLKLDGVAGTATAGIPHAAWIADRLNLPMAYVRGGSKVHGKENQIEGIIRQGQTILLVEDLISTGGSSIAALEALKQAGAEVPLCVAIFSYQMEKAQKRFKSAPCKLLTLSNFSILVDVAVQSAYLDGDKAAMVKEWNKNPAEWGKTMGFES